MPSRRQPPRTAVNRDSLPSARRIVARDRRLIDGEANIVGNKQIEVAIPVIVDKTAPRTPARLCVQQPCLFRNVGKRTVAIIAIKPVLPEVSAKDIFKPVVVVVSDANSVSPADSVQPRFLRHVGESAIAIVFVKAVCGLRWCAFKTCSTEQKHVHPSVIVIIDERTATSINRLYKNNRDGT